MVLDASKAFFFIAKISQIVCISSRVGFGRIQNHFIPYQNQSNCVHLLGFAYFRLLKSVKLYAFSLELVLGASKTILFRAKISQIVQVYLGMVLDACKAILFSAKISQIVCILSRVGFGRIQSHFFHCKTSQIVSIFSRVGFGCIQNHFIPCQNQSNCVHLLEFAYFRLLKSVKVYAFSLELVLDASKTVLFRAKISQIV